MHFGSGKAVEHAEFCIRLRKCGLVSKYFKRQLFSLMSLPHRDFENFQSRKGARHVTSLDNYYVFLRHRSRLSTNTDLLHGRLSNTN
jgi:hypothetical protein